MLPGRCRLRLRWVGLHHKICHVLGGTFDLPHAETHAIVLPHVLALNAPAVPAGRLRFSAEHIPDAVERILAAAPASNPVPVTEANITALLTHALGAHSDAVLDSR